MKESASLQDFVTAHCNMSKHVFLVKSAKEVAVSSFSRIFIISDVCLNALEGWEILSLRVTHACFFKRLFLPREGMSAANNRRHNAMYKRVMINGTILWSINRNQWPLLCPLTPVDTGQLGSPTGMIALSSMDIIRTRDLCWTEHPFTYCKIVPYT